MEYFIEVLYWKKQYLEKQKYFLLRNDQNKDPGGSGHDKEQTRQTSGVVFVIMLFEY